MKLQNSKPLYSASDLLAFLGCTHATALDIEVLGGGLERGPSGDDEYLDILKEKGMEHERAYLETLRSQGRSIVEIVRSSDEESVDSLAERTRAAMRSGADVIYQGALTAPGWHGYSDFLLKVDTPS